MALSKESKELTVKVKGYALPYSTEHVGSICLLEFQERIRRAKERLVLLNAPTGSGKTLAYLLHGIENFSTTIILYPTKELMEDQAKNIVKLLNNLGRQITEVDVDEKNESTRSNTNEFDVVLLVANGDTLRYWADKEESSEGKAFLNKLKEFTPCKHLILLTNIDILYLLLRSSFFASPEIFKMVASRGKALLVVDEFHLYFGFSLLVLVTAIKLLIYATSNPFIQRVIFSSATSIDLSKVFNEKIEVIEAKYYSSDYTEKEARISRFDTILKIRPIDYLVYSESDINKVLSEAIALYNDITTRNVNLDRSTINVLIILNSIISCEALYKKLLSNLKNGVKRISSYVPRKERQLYTSYETKILVGTSAIEVGIDFDSYSLIFEASDAYSFIQRFGRVSRKRCGEAVVFVPNYSFSKIKDKLSGKNEVSYYEFIKVIEDSMFKSKGYEDFSLSQFALALVLGIFAAIEKRINREADKNKLSQLVSSDKYKEIYKKIFPCALIEKTLPIQQDVTLERFFMFSVDNASARENLSSIPCYLEEFDTFTLVSITDLVKFDFELKEKSEISSDLKKKLPHSYAFENANQLAIIHKISLEKVKHKLYLGSSCIELKKILLGKHIIECVTNVVTTLDQKYIEELKKAICCSYGVIGFEEDWRLTHLKVKVNNKDFVLYLGADAFLYYYLENKNKYKPVD
jgi:CRISPR-associated helicase Cas3